MIDIIVFGEDYAHEIILQTLLERLAAEHDLTVKVHIRSAAGGHARMMRELKQYLAELDRGKVRLPDLFVVARDANCKGYATRVKEIKETMGKFEGLVVLAVPDPHAERWQLIDSKAFKSRRSWATDVSHPIRNVTETATNNSSRMPCVSPASNRCWADSNSPRILSGP